MRQSDRRTAATTPAPSSLSPSSLDLNQWYSYHKSKAHDTRDCRHLVDALFTSYKKRTSNVEPPKPRPNNAKNWSKSKEKKAQKPQDKAGARSKRAEDDKPDEQDEDEACAGTEQPRNRTRVQVILARPSSSSDKEEDAKVCNSQEHPVGLQSESSDPSGTCDLRSKLKRKSHATESTHESGSDLRAVINKSKAERVVSNSIRPNLRPRVLDLRDHLNSRSEDLWIGSIDQKVPT